MKRTRNPVHDQVQALKEKWLEHALAAGHKWSPGHPKYTVGSNLTTIACYDGACTWEYDATAESSYT